MFNAFNLIPLSSFDFNTINVQISPRRKCREEKCAGEVEGWS